MERSEETAGDGPSPGSDPATRPAGTRTLLVGIAATVAVLLAAGALALTGEDEPDPVDAQGALGTPEVGAEPGEPLPDVELAGFAGGDAVQTRAYEGEPLVVNFWATWCPPCVEEMPAFQEVAEDVGAPTFLGVNLEDDEEKAERLVEDLGVTYDLAVDADGTLFAEVEGFGMPTTLLVDAQGTIRYRHTGPLDAEQLRGLLAAHLEHG